MLLPHSPPLLCTLRRSQPRAMRTNRSRKQVQTHSRSVQPLWDSSSDEHSRRSASATSVALRHCSRKQPHPQPFFQHPSFLHENAATVTSRIEMRMIAIACCHCFQRRVEIKLDSDMHAQHTRANSSVCGENRKGRIQRETAEQY